MSDKDVSYHPYSSSHTWTKLHKSQTQSRQKFYYHQCLTHEAEQKLQQHINPAHTICSKYDLKINNTDFEVMRIGKKHSDLKIKINDTQTQQVQDLKYLGSISREDGRPNIESTSPENQSSHLPTSPTPQTSKSATTSQTTDGRQHLHT